MARHITSLGKGQNLKFQVKFECISLLHHPEVEKSLSPTTVKSRLSVHILPHLTYFEKLLFESNSMGRGFVKRDLPRRRFPFPSSGEGTREKGIELLRRPRLPPTSRSCLAKLDLGAGDLHPSPRSSRWEGGWFFPGHWRTLSSPSHLLWFHAGSRLSGGRQGHSNPPTTRADVAGEGGAIALPFQYPALTRFLLKF